MMDIQSALSEDGKLLEIAMVDELAEVASITLDAEQVSLLLQELGRQRAQMAEPVSRTLEPLPVFRDVTRGAVFHVDRQHAMAKEFFIAARHEGFGWLAFTLGADTGRVLASMIEKQVRDISPRIMTPRGRL